MEQTLYLLDAMSLVFRAYYAMARNRRPLQSPSGVPTGATFGYAAMLTALLERYNPDAIACAFDTKEPTHRHDAYADYKAHREPFPEDLVPQLDYIKALTDALGIARIEIPGYEADDIIGTLATRAADAGYRVFCVTSDKDFYQLVSDRISLLKPNGGGSEYLVHGIAECRQRFGVEPSQVIEVLALMGDTSDNIPGVHGIGEKTAIKLIAKYGSLEELYAHLDDIEQPKLRENLERDRQQAFLSRELATIHRDIELPITLDDCKRRPPNAAALFALFDELGFNQLKARWASILGSAPEPPPTTQATLDDIEHQYTTITSMEQLADLVAQIERSAAALALDLETTSLDAMTCHIVGIALSLGSTTDNHHRAWYIPTADADCQDTAQLFETASEQSCGLPIAEVLAVLKPLLERATLPKWGQNLKFDTLILRRYGVDVRPISFDAMLASYVLDPDAQHGMDALAERWLGYKPIPITDLIGARGSNQRSMRHVPIETVSRYACEDADVTFHLCVRLGDALRAVPELDQLARQIEFPLVRVLSLMEFNGVAVDSEQLAELSTKLNCQIEQLRDRIYAEAGTEFSIDSPKQLGHVLFEKMQLPVLKKTKSGYSTDASVLSELAPTFPIAQYVLDYRQLQKLRSTYVETLPRMINPRTGRIHTTFSQTMTSTGRLSSAEPNLQNIPIRTEIGRAIRRAFIAQQPGWKIFSADYSQIELRIMAHISGDETLRAAFREGKDIHAATAAVLFGVSESDVDAEMRRVAKTVNFGIMYGLGEFGLAQRLGIPRGEAKRIIENYFARYPKIADYIERTIAFARQHGYVQTLLGRRRYFPDITSKNATIRAAAERAAINMPIQGTAADMIKRAMIAIAGRMEHAQLRSMMILQVHDELVFEVHPQEEATLVEIVTAEMERALPLGDVPVVVNTSIGTSWDESA
ncbi:MAG: DNA polymerase I [Candidatus Kapaibacterium sp.]|nr:MAG: DNA polymerase I [Candidatus Kapabacteria bacterium]